MLEKILYHVIFYGFALLVINSAVVVAVSRNIVHSAFALLLTFFGIAGLYVFLSAPFMAAIQVLIYVGGILVLILFAVMLTHKISEVQLSNPATKPWVAGPLVLIILLGLMWVFIATDWPVKQATAEFSTKDLGNAIMGPYLLPFEAVSALLLAALIGAAFLARPLLRNKDKK